jgi:hypothetical protein
LRPAQIALVDQLFESGDYGAAGDLELCGQGAARGKSLAGMKLARQNGDPQLLGWPVRMATRNCWVSCW